MADNDTTNDVDLDVDDTQDTGDDDTGKGNDQFATILQDYRTLMGDANVQELIRAAREGRNVRIVDADANADVAGAADDADDDLDLDLPDGDPDVSKVITSVLKKQLEPVMRDVASLKELAGSMQNERVSTQIKDLQQKHPDFKKYKDSMAKLSRDNPGLGLEDLYLIAKARAGELNLSEPSTESERPTAMPRRPMSRPKKPGEMRGRRAFQSTLADALEKL